MNKETIEEAKLRAANYMSLKGVLEPKQETLEEVAKRIYGSDASKDVEYYAFLNGAKWQQERMYEIMDLYADDVMGGCTLRAKEWFEQFKNK